MKDTSSHEGTFLLGHGFFGPKTFGERLFHQASDPCVLLTQTFTPCFLFLLFISWLLQYLMLSYLCYSFLITWCLCFCYLLCSVGCFFISTFFLLILRTLLTPTDCSYVITIDFQSFKESWDVEDKAELLVYGSSGLRMFWLGLVFILYQETTCTCVIIVKSLYSYFILDNQLLLGLFC